MYRSCVCACLQGVMYREVCVRALERLRTLELQQEQQERLLQELRSSSSAMVGTREGPVPHFPHTMKRVDVSK